MVSLGTYVKEPTGSPTSKLPLEFKSIKAQSLNVVLEVLLMGRPLLSSQVVTVPAINPPEEVTVEDP